MSQGFRLNLNNLPYLLSRTLWRDGGEEDNRQTNQAKAKTRKKRGLKAILTSPVQPSQGHAQGEAMASNSESYTGKYDKKKLLGKGTFGEAWLVLSR